MSDYITVFISSKQMELEAERLALADKIRSIPFLEPMLAEEWSPQRSAPQDVFLDQVRRAPIYVGLFSCIYSKPTEMEYRAAIENPYREVLIYLKRSPDSGRETALQRLISEFREQHVLYEFTTIGDLLSVFTAHIRSSLNRMIALLQKLGEGPPAGRAKSNILTERWERQRAEIQNTGLLDNASDAAAWIQRLSDSLRMISIP